MYNQNLIVLTEASNNNEFENNSSNINLSYGSERASLCLLIKKNLQTKHGSFNKVNSNNCTHFEK